MGLGLWMGLKGIFGGIADVAKNNPILRNAVLALLALLVIFLAYQWVEDRGYDRGAAEVNAEMNRMVAAQERISRSAKIVMESKNKTIVKEIAVFQAAAAQTQAANILKVAEVSTNTEQCKPTIVQVPGADEDEGDFRFTRGWVNLYNAGILNKPAENTTDPTLTAVGERRLLRNATENYGACNALAIEVDGWRKWHVDMSDVLKKAVSEQEAVRLARGKITKEKK